MPKIDRVSLIFSLNSFAAAVLALWIGFELDLPRPYWAVMTVYIVSQPMAGAVRSKALYRVLGTLLGAVFSVAVVPVLVNEPLLLSLVMALWVGLCLFLSLLDRTPRAYVVMLAGYTATLISFPTVNVPTQIFDVAVSRVEEIVLGILCATITHSLFFPRPVGVALCQRLSSWLTEADGWALDLLKGNAGRIAEDRRHLAAAAGEIHMLSVLLPFDTSSIRDTAASVRAIHQRFLVLIPVLSGIADRLTALASIGAAPGAACREALTRTADWIVSGAAAEPGRALLRDFHALAHQDRDDSWAGLLRRSLFARLQDLVLELGEAHALLAALTDPDAARSPRIAEAVARQSRKVLHRDVGLAAISGFAASLAILLVCVLWIATGWPDGSIAAALAGVFCALFAALDDPAPAIVGFGVFSLFALVVAAFYVFAILPGIDGFPLLALALAPSFLLAGYLMPNRRTALPGLAFAIGLGSSLALQETYQADFAAFVNSNGALYVGLLVALVVTRAIRSLSTEAAAQRILRRTWTRLAALARGQVQGDPYEIAAEMVDRIGLLIPKLAAAPDSGLSGAQMLTDLRAGMNIAMLRQTDRTDEPAMAEMLRRIGDHFAALAAGKKALSIQPILAALDSALSRLDAAEPVAVTALVGLRRNLFPDAPAFAKEAAP